MWLLALIVEVRSGFGSSFPGVVDGPAYQHPAGRVEKRQAAGLGLLAEPPDNCVNIGRAPIGAATVHLDGVGQALASSVGHYANPSQKLFELGAWQSMPHVVINPVCNPSHNGKSVTLVS